MDEISNQLATYACARGRDTFTATSREAAVWHILDSIGCMIGGRNSVPASVAGRVARNESGSRGSRVFVHNYATTVGMAAFVNTVMMRYLDYNDTFIGRGGLHPSDILPALIAVADAEGCTGEELVDAMIVGYEILGAFSNAVTIRERGWDQGTFIVIATAAAIARLLRCDVNRTAEAVALAAIPNVATRQTRVGELSMWKGCATAAAARAGIFAAQLAAEGMTGPSQPFEGHHGICELVTGPLDLQLPAGQVSAVEAAHLKYYPSEYHSQAPLKVLQDIRSGFKVTDLNSIDISTYWVAYSEIGSEAAKWDPRTRETADHSLPYLAANMLLEGDIWLDSFEPEKFRDPATLALMQRIHISESKAFTELYPQELRSEIVIRLRSGDEITRVTDYPRGHFRNPMSSDEIVRKYERQAGEVFSGEHVKLVEEMILALDRPTRVSELVDLLAPHRSDPSQSNGRLREVSQ